LDRQQFLQTLTSIPLITTLDNLNKLYSHYPTDEFLTNEDYWEEIRKQFYLDDHNLDFRCHAASPLPKDVLNSFIKDYKYIQAFPSSRNHEIAEGEKEQLRVSLANEINCSVQELAIMRSTTEALNNVIMGFPFQKDDEVIGSVHEYDSMFASLYQQQLRWGIKVKQINIPYQPESTEQILDIWRKSITPKTKMFLISHMVWISGQVYPVKEICALAKQHNIYTVIDAAQSFSHIPVDVKDIDCDYLGASLHKWAAAPLGTGFMYIKKKHIAMTMPLMGHYQYKADEDAIEKFENFGSATPVFNTAALSIAYWKKLGNSLKTQRMQYLKSYWTEKLKHLPAITILTNTNETQSCGVAYFQIKDKSSKAISELLMKQYNISVQAIENYKNQFVDYKNVNAIGIATPVFITVKQLNKFCAIIKEIVK
jgi:selenocysteine lyase/cysteine desulfurase